MLAITPTSNININSVHKGFQKLHATPFVQNYKSTNLKSYPSNYYTQNISFGDSITRNIEFEDYKEMSTEDKEIMRNKYKDFHKLVKNSELYKPRRTHDSLPLSSEEEMDEFIEFSSLYNKYKKNHIICLGRSPKWFLNASIWMKGGIENYAMAAFSNNWYHRNNYGVGKDLFRDEQNAPTQEQKNAYFKYMKSIKCDPKSIIKKATNTHKPVIITDYIHSGCGVTSYLDLMAEFAQKQDCLEDFVKSIKLVTIGSNEYVTDDWYLGYTPYYKTPRVLLPENLKPYENIIPQEYHDMSAELLKDMLINKNTNECRATYYPPEAWTIYNPKRYHTGMMSDEEIAKIKMISSRTVYNYTDAMKDYRNLMNFRILDGLAQRNLLKSEHRTR